MRAVIGFATKIVFYVFVCVVLLWTCSLTLELLTQVLPGDDITPFFGLALFDGGALAWLLVFIFLAQGLGQRALSLLMMALDLLGVALMSGADLFLSGQEFTAVPAGLGSIVVWCVGIWTLANVASIYAYHILEPETSQSIELRTEADKLRAESLSQARERLSSKSVVIGSHLADRLEQQVMLELRLLGDGVLDGEALEPAALLTTKSRSSGKRSPGLLERLQSVLERQEPSEVRTYASESAAIKLEPEPKTKKE